MEKIYNLLLAEEADLINDKLFGVWKQRLLILSVRLNYTIVLSQDIIVIAVVLYNLGPKINDTIPEDKDVEVFQNEENYGHIENNRATDE